MILYPHVLTIDTFCQMLEEHYLVCYGDTDPPHGEIASWAARLALENIANSNMLYHDLEHTVMVVSAGQSIIHGKQLLDGGISPNDWLDVTLATIFHDIGYRKGICNHDNATHFVTSSDQSTVELPVTSTDAALAPYHVDRGQIFVRERFGNSALRKIDVERICDYIEMTRFPVPADEKPGNPDNLGTLVRAADMVGQLGDPNYLRKIPALYYEFEELGWNDKMGYKSPWDLRQNYSRFYWQSVHPHIEPVMPYLQATQSGRQWIANLYAHIFEVEHSI